MEAAKWTPRLTDEQIEQLAKDAGFGFFGQWMLWQGDSKNLLRFARTIEVHASGVPPAPIEKVALDIAKWFVNGDRPDEWKLKEWAERLDRDAIAKAYEARAAISKALGGEQQ